MEELKNKRNTNLKYFISMDLQENKNGVISLNKLIENGKEHIEKGDRKFLDTKLQYYI